MHFLIRHNIRIQNKDEQYHNKPFFSHRIEAVPQDVAEVYVRPKEIYVYHANSEYDVRK